MQKLVKLVIKISRKVCKPKTYDKSVNNLINRNKWQKVINKKFWNLDSYQTWYYTILPLNYKLISYK